MNQKTPNNSIRCRVKSCEYHFGKEDYCSLQAIQVDPSPNCSSGQIDESMCASYHSKSK